MVFAEFLEALLRIDVHTAELEEVEDGVVSTDTLGLKEYRSWTFQSDGNSCQDEYRRQKDDAQAGEDDVEETLPDGYLEFEDAVFRSFVVEKDVFTVRNEQNLLVQLCDGCFLMDGVIDTAFHVQVTFLTGHGVRDEYDVDIAAFLTQIGDCSDVLAAHISFKEH